MPVPKIQSVHCDNCGAPLKIPDGVRYVTCQHCAANLQVEHTADVIYTQSIEEVSRRVDETQTRLRELETQQKMNRMAQLDADWDSKKRELLGTTVEPELGKNDWVWVIAGVVIVGLIAVALIEKDWEPAIMALVVFVGCVLFLGKTLITQYDYQQELSAYRRRRRAIERGISSSETD